MEWLKPIAEHHNEWVNMVKSFGERNYPEDIVQEAYIRIWKYSSPEKILKNGNPNKGFMWIVLKNTYSLYLKEKAKRKKVSLYKIAELSDDNTPLCRKFAQYKLDKLIDSETDNWHWYDKMLFKYYLESGKSLRQIEAETNISLTSLFNTMKNCKQRLKENVSEDWEDFKNEDWELL